MRFKTAKIAAILIFFGALAYAAAAQEFIDNSETLWLDHDYVESDAALDEALKASPSSTEKADIYWRKARNQYEIAEELPRDDKKTRLNHYMDVQKLS